MNAKYYTYRNLNYEDHFSTKYRGKVIDYFNLAVIRNGKFQVSDAGRERCLRTKKRNVHAFIVSSDEPSILADNTCLPVGLDLVEVKYNPYRSNTFTRAGTDEPVTSAERIYLFDGRCFINSN